MSMFDPWSPIPGAQQPPTEGSFLDDPRLRGALLQSGLALMQPPSFGDNPASLIGRAIGAGGESVQRQEAQDLKQQEADSKAALREAQATAAGARSDTAAARANTAEARLALGRLHEEGLKNRSMITGAVQLSKIYQNYKKNTEAGNAAVDKDIMARPEEKAARKVPVQSWSDWLKGDGAAAAARLGLTPDAAGLAESLSSAATPSAAAPVDPLEKARRAIAAGADKASVKQRLQDAGIDASGL